jgi:tRNA nucleotidyltransferase/poly(A) polymerase
MANIFNDDFRDFIAALNKHQVEYLLVGGYAVILNGYRRTTGDLDIWVNVTPENHKKLLSAYLTFGLPTSDISEANFLKNKEIEVFTYGIPPVCIDVMKVVKGCDFAEAYKLSTTFIEDDLEIRFIYLNTLIQAKKASGRYKDLDDIEKLQQ